ncbi:MAG TPA: hydantoinase/oxoprolinase family protein [Candidatus Methylomirabilis sp.]|nr:hydantoinase/oxoprolinase family protein [Candidatus Methylomirabilis sp.]
MLWVGVDVGGTFTDVVVYDESDETIRVGKATTVPADPTQGLLQAFAKLGVRLPATERLVHGTTIGTNAILERKGADVWVITTRGFGDTLEIARTNRAVLYDIRALKPASLVPRQRVVEVDERMAYDGTVLRPLDPVGASEAAERMAAVTGGGGPAAAAICFLHSYANPAHEETAARIVRERLPSWFVCTSREVLPEFREYERFSTTVLNAYIGPLVARYLTSLAATLAGLGHTGKVFITTSSGGITTSEVAARFPVHTVLSGPAGGVAAALHLGRLTGWKNLITCDMGGTSTDVCLIEQLEATLSTEQHIAGLPNRTPQIDINSIGAGGGSLAWLDAGDTLRVGPRSAGATPGPACYGRGGLEPTITDANLLLGRVPADVPLAGEVKLDEGLARTAIGNLLGRIPGLSTEEELADGIVRIATARMVSAIKEISMAKGYDPRDFALLAYGGAGPMHAAFVAEELEIPRVVVPWAPGNFSAFGSLIGDLRRDYVQTRLLPTRGAAFADVVDTFAALEREATSALAAEGVAPERIWTLRTLGMRYVGQAWEVLVRVPDDALGIEALEEAFHRSHERRYGHRNDGAVEIVNFRLTVVGTTAKPSLPRPPDLGSVADARRTERPVSFDGAFIRSPVYVRERLPQGARLPGPAIVEEMGATTVVPPLWSATVGASGELLLERSGV